MPDANIYGTRSSIRQALNEYWHLKTEAQSHDRIGTDSIAIIIDIENAIKSLPEIHRKIIFLNLIIGYSTGEVSRRVGKPRSTVIDMVNQALDGIKTYLEGQYH